VVAALSSVEQISRPPLQRSARSARFDDLRRKNSKLALVFEPHSKVCLLALNSLDTFEQIAGGGI
jgi:hypothetical protein